MAQLDTGGGDGGGKHKKKRAKRSSNHIDMTPMVDLAFLLLTFFMLTTTFNKPKTLEINMPAEPPPDQKPIKVTNALTVLLSDEKVFWYFGEFKPGVTTLEETKLSKDGLRKLLLDKNAWTIDQLKKLEADLKTQSNLPADTLSARYKRERSDILKKNKSLTVLLKADDKADYKNVVDVLDELQITDVGKFAIVDLMPQEQELLKAKM
jgi:biopolymer transport protein ExbD